MGKYIFKRVLLAIVTIFIVCFITFFTMNAIPGGPFAGEKAKSPEVQAALEKRFNLDKPVGEQFVIYMKNLLHDFFPGCGIEEVNLSGIIPGHSRSVITVWHSPRVKSLLSR